jgi:hypothetical protein
MMLPSIANPDDVVGRQAGMGKELAQRKLAVCVGI